MNQSTIVTCPNCKMRVFPKADGTCPSCHVIIPQRGNKPISRSDEPTEKSVQPNQEPASKPKVVRTTRAVHQRNAAHDSASTKPGGNTEGKSVIGQLGLVMLVVGFLLLVPVIFHFPSQYWDQGVGEVRWYKMDGVEVVNNEVQIRLSPVQPEKGDPSSEELTQHAIDFDPAFFNGSPINERVNLGVLPGSKGYDLRIYLAGKLREKVDMSFFSSLSAYEVLASPRTRNGYVIAGAIVLLGLILFISGRMKAKKENG